MKTNEIVKEGPFDGVRQAFQGAAAGWTARQAANKFQKDVDAVAKDAYSDWAGVLSTINPNTSPDQIEQQLVTWGNNAFKDKVPGPSQVPPPGLQNAKDYTNMYKYIRARSEEYWSARAGQGPQHGNSTGIRGPLSQSQIPTGYAAPKRNTSVNIRGNNYIFNKRTGKWTDAQGKEVVIPGDIELLNQTAYSALNPSGTPTAAQTTTTQPTQSARVPTKLRTQVLADVQQFIGQSQLKAVNTYLAPYIQQSGNTVRSTGVPQVDAFLNILGVKTK